MKKIKSLGNFFRPNAPMRRGFSPEKRGTTS